MAVKEPRMTLECDQFDPGQEFVLDNIDCPPSFVLWPLPISNGISPICFSGGIIRGSRKRELPWLVVRRLPAGYI